MSSGSAPSEGFRGFVKRSARRAKKVFRPEVQVSTSRTPTPQPQFQSEPSTKAPSPKPSLSQEQATQPPDLLRQSAPSPQLVPRTEQPTSTSPVATSGVESIKGESGLAQAAKKAGADAWSGLKVTLKLVEKSSDVFPPLKSAVAGFLGVVDIFETAAQNREDYAKLASNLQAMVQEFAERPGEQTSTKMLEALNAMASGLQKETEHVQEQRQRSGFRRHLEAGQDSDDVKECYERVETLRRALQDKAMMRLWSIGEEQQMDARLKELNPALKAMYNSSISTVIGRRKCTPGTREAILAGMREWADNPDGPRVYWLNGMAGTGKTTLAYSFCDEMQVAGRLGGSFFCSRADADSQDVSRIIPTIAYQLARLLPSYREALIQQIGEDKDIGARTIEMQFEKLIRDPLRETKLSEPKDIVVTIDALDECSRRDGAQDILSVLMLNAGDLPIKFFITCRPEPGLFDVLQSEEHRRSVLHLHEIESSFVQADIRTYLDAELGTMSLSRGKVDQLAEQAGTLFIYAATAVRYIRPKVGKVKSDQRLDQLLSITSKSKSNRHKGIDDLYTAVLAAPFADEDIEGWEKENIRQVLDTAICAREPMSVTTIAKLLELDDDDDVTNALQHLRSVLRISQGANLVSTLHASFPDFMLDRERSKDLYCNTTTHHKHIALRCFSTMERLLHFNICGLESSFVLDEKVQDLSTRVSRAIPPELFYACRYWGDHLGYVNAVDDVFSALEAFLSNQLLFWMEVLNLKNCISPGAQMLARVHVWLRKSPAAINVVELALDASRFVTAFGMSSASRSTPHIYISALPFWPRTRPVGERYWKQTKGLIRLEGPAMEQRDLSCLATWNAAGRVHCVAFSPDGACIVSGSGDGTIRVWDARSGDLMVGPLEGHTDGIASVAYSPDGTHIVSGAFDNTIRVWDSRSGRLVAGPFEGHTSYVDSVAFSPDGTHIVSHSQDKTARVWDARSGALVAGPFEGHSGGIASVAYSPDGTQIVSGSYNGTITVWDARNGHLVAGPFEGHTGQVMSIAFSPDGSRIVSGSEDKTIRVCDSRDGHLISRPFEGHTMRVASVTYSPDGTHIVSSSSNNICVWDAQSGHLVAGPYEGHTMSITSVALSPDGTCIVSGSYDSTIRVWETYSGLLVNRPFEGHTSPIYSVAFSPDGTLLVSGSYDKTIRVWDACSGHLVAGPFEGHTKGICCVSFSSDGTRIVSGSWDKTIRVWDARSGILLAGPFEGHMELIHCVVFSPDDARIASSSFDCTIRVWDTHSGALVAGPFEGHTSSVNCVCFSPNGSLIISGSSDATIRVWDARSGDLAAGPFEGHTDGVTSMANSPDGTHIVSGSFDNTICVWDARNGNLVAGPFEGHSQGIASVAYSPDGTHIASSSYDNTIRIWDARSGHLVAGPFEGHTGWVNSVAFSPDGSRIVSGSHDAAIRVWDSAPFYAHDSEDFKGWLIGEQGMVTNRQGQLLLCVPADLWTGLMQPHNIVCVYRRGALQLDFDGVLIGDNWVDCYRS